MQQHRPATRQQLGLSSKRPRRARRQEQSNRPSSATSCPNMECMMAVSAVRGSRRFVHWRPIVEQNMQSVVVHGNLSSRINALSAPPHLPHDGKQSDMPKPPKDKRNALLIERRGTTPWLNPVLWFAKSAGFPVATWPSSSNMWRKPTSSHLPS